MDVIYSEKEYSHRWQEETSSHSRDPLIDRYMSMAIRMQSKIQSLVRPAQFLSDHQLTLYFNQVLEFQQVETCI